MPTGERAMGRETPAGERPAKLTPLYHKHLNLGGKMTEWAGWLVPESYVGAEQEARSALESVGLAEESSNTKIDIKGTEIDGFITRILNVAGAPEKPGQVSLRPSLRSWEGLPVRYLCRLAKDHALLVVEGSKSPSTNSPIRVENPHTKDFRVYLTNVTSVLACMTLVGPNAPQLLRKLTDLETSYEGSAGPACAEGPVAGVQTLMVRSALQLGAGSVRFNEIYCGRDYAEYLWDAIAHAGSEYGLVPIGTTALRSIRDRASPASRRRGTQQF